jgi:photosystem II stability/assembly factor-like uncharacterized protein
LFFYFKGSAQWTQQNSGITDQLNQVFFPSPDTGFVISINPQSNLLRTFNGGLNWNVVQTPYNIIQVFFTSSEIGYATTNSNELIKTTDAGSTWSVIRLCNDFYSLAGIYFSDNNTGYAPTCKNSDYDTTFFLKTTDAGLSWNVASGSITQSTFLLPTNNSMQFFSNSVGFVTFPAGVSISRTSNGAGSFSTVSSGNVFTCLNFPLSSVGYAGVYPDQLFKSANGGNTWSQVSTPFSGEFVFCMQFVSIDTGFVMVSSGSFMPGRIMKTTNGGVNWNVQFPTNSVMYSMHFPVSNIGYAAGENGVILKYNTLIGIDDLSSSDNSMVIYKSSSCNYSVQLENDVQNAELTVIDISGQWKLKRKVNGKLFEFDTNQLADGMYFVNLQTSKGKLSRKFIFYNE